jgi:hypothetical protein
VLPWSPRLVEGPKAAQFLVELFTKWSRYLT